MTGKRRADEIVRRLGDALGTLDAAGYAVAAGTTCCVTCFHAERPADRPGWVFYTSQEEDELRRRRGAPLMGLYWRGDVDEIRGALEAAGMAVEVDGDGLLWTALPGDLPDVSSPAGRSDGA